MFLSLLFLHKAKQLWRSVLLGILFGCSFVHKRKQRALSFSQSGPSVDRQGGWGTRGNSGAGPTRGPIRRQRAAGTKRGVSEGSATMRIMTRLLVQKASVSVPLEAAEDAVPQLWTGGSWVAAGVHFLTLQAATSRQQHPPELRLENSFSISLNWLRKMLLPLSHSYRVVTSSRFATWRMCLRSVRLGLKTRDYIWITYGAIKSFFSSKGTKKLLSPKLRNTNYRYSESDILMGKKAKGTLKNKTKPNSISKFLNIAVEHGPEDTFSDIQISIWR